MKPPATAGESLRGLAEPRDNPPTPIPVSAAANLSDLLADHYSDEAPTPGPVRVVTHTAATTVATLGDPPAAVLKVHTDRARYDRETLAYALTQPTVAVPQLLHADDTSRSLLIEYLPHPIRWRRPGAPGALVAAVAAIHCVSAIYTPATAAAAAPLRHVATPGWITDAGAWLDVLVLCRHAHGPEHIPLGHLDLKPDHLRRRSDGTPVVVDLETLRPDTTGLIDLITLPAVLRQASHPLPPRRLLDLYADAAERLGCRWTPGLLRTALTTFARATGLATLNGLTD